MMVFSLAEYIILFCGGLQTLGFLRHVRPSIVRIDPRSKCANRRHANPTPRTGCVSSMHRVYMGDAGAHSGMLLAKTVSDLEGGSVA